MSLEFLIFTAIAEPYNLLRANMSVLDVQKSEDRAVHIGIASVRRAAIGTIRREVLDLVLLWSM